MDGRSVHHAAITDVFPPGCSVTVKMTAETIQMKPTLSFAHSVIALEIFDVRIVAASQCTGCATLKTIVETSQMKILGCVVRFFGSRNSKE